MNGRNLSNLPSFFDKVVVEEGQAAALQVSAPVQVAPQEWPKQRNEISVVVLKTLSQSASFRVESSGVNEERIFLGLKLGIKHHSVHDVVQHQLQTLPDNNPFGSNHLVCLEVINNQIHFLLPHDTMVLYNFVCEKREGHDSPHFAPMVSVDCEDHILSVASEYVKDDIAGPGAELDSLSVKDLVGELWVRHNNQFFGAEL